ncbi:MAG: RNA-binding protein [Desulfurellaceae bacterium]|jgi:RNA recognition motif-containing protein|nr:RNA-binding protein [Desulfurellaceae bacterium]
MKTSKLYVGNLSYRTTEETVRDAFAQYGNVVSARVFEGKGFGFVEMGTIEEAEAAKEALNETDIEGRNIRVDEARPRQERPYRR